MSPQTMEGGILARVIIQSFQIVIHDTEFEIQFFQGPVKFSGD